MPMSPADAPDVAVAASSCSVSPVSVTSASSVAPATVASASPKTARLTTSA